MRAAISKPVLSRHLTDSLIDAASNTSKQLLNMLEARLLILRKVQNLHKQVGWRGVRRKVASVLKRHIEAFTGFDRNNYGEWLRRYGALNNKRRSVIMGSIEKMPAQLISVIIPVSMPDAKLELMADAISSVQAQLYPHWQLHIVGASFASPIFRQQIEQLCRGDTRIKLLLDTQASPISAAINRGLSATSAQWVAMLGQHDVLSEHALYYVAQTILTNPDAAIIYSDEDKIDTAGTRHEPAFKPDWNPELLLSGNTIGNLTIYQRKLINTLGGVRADYDGAHYYDLTLRCVEQVKPTQIIHIPRVLYHSRSDQAKIPKSKILALNEITQGLRAITDHLERTEVVASAEVTTFGSYRVKYSLPPAQPMVSMIIPTRNGLQLIQQCIGSILAKTLYENYEILVIDNNSSDPATLRYLASLESEEKLHVVRDARPFNYSALNNNAINIAQGDYLCLLNNDIEVISPDWLNEMLGLAIQPGIGAVGARLWYPDNTLQHAGVITGIGGIAGHVHRRLVRDSPGYLGRAQRTQSFSAVTAACLLVKKQIYQEVGGLDEENLAVAFNDVDFCLRVKQAGYRNVWTPYAELYHHESASRGREDTLEKYDRFSQEVQYMKQRWGDNLKNDPAYNPNLTLEHEDCSLAWPPREQELEALWNDKRVC
ncbi:glycosyl transferase family 2 [Pollutimonas nitritireducens]|uniref:Glycosyl transferase family 2 n=1 Tax=Pollutimonas nitritireducens TaxID=2045209 RepID=A0A2N4UBT5_9BURK|nr:glycosyltransferase family 2 protein [Pollutimonas nitritireducens]PLC52486.1 glycosyl transferase family 2 [Pollutimonas nitritireducens]